MLTSADIQANRFLKPSPPKAAQLIVTIYGDIVEPRGGVLWMGDLISLCAGFGVNESLVRTAMSRLVSKGQLIGEREGRRSYYGLTEAARREYHTAADLFFGPADSDCEWIVTICPDQAEQAVLMENGFVPLGGNTFIGADRGGRPRLGAAFRSGALDPEAKAYSGLIASAFQLDGLGRDYVVFADTFQPMRSLIDESLPAETALQCRLALVHAYRTIRLKDPRVPPSVLPKDWPGFAARSLFSDLYRRLSGPADDYIGRNLLTRNGPLPARPAAVQRRLETLAVPV